jgi:RNA polymerase sigma-70 factor (ECF subfamily)
MKVAASINVRGVAGYACPQRTSSGCAPGGVLTPADDSDEALIARVGRGDRLAASAIVLRHSDAVLGLAWRMLGERAAAEDATQETFLKFWSSAGEWRPQGARVKTWLLKIAANACLDRLRRRGREVATDSPPELADHAPAADEKLMREERRAAVDAALAALPERQRLALVLCHYEELSQNDAAEALNVSVEALESLLARGRRALRAALIERRDELFMGERHGRSSIAL